MNNRRIPNVVLAATALACTTSVTLAAKTGGAENLASVATPTQYRFGSPAFIQEWNRRCDTNQNPAKNSSVAVVPRYGFAPHAPAIPNMPGTAGGGDYFNEEISRGAMRWSHMPLSVYVQAGGMGYSQQYSQIFTAAENEWTRISQGRVRFVNAPSPYEADITVDWLPGSPGAGEAGNTKTAFANCGGQRAMTHAHVDLAGTVSGRPMTDSEMRKTCLHELGHALGLVHTSQPGDIMYFQSNPNQSGILSARDGGTICRLYGS